MRIPILVFLILLGREGAAMAQTALQAVKLLPHGEAKRLARIEGREGTPVPNRWYLIVQDPKSETGVHEYVVAGGEIVASRNVSQFAESLQETDVIGADALKIDSDQAAKIAARYALANNATLSAMHYELRREGVGAAPLWNLTCVDSEGKALGHIVITAGKGNVISHEGFPALPRATPAPEPEKKRAPEKPKRSTPTPTPKADEPAIAPPEPIIAATPIPVRKPNFFERVGGTLQKVMPGRKPELQPQPQPQPQATPQ